MPRRRQRRVHTRPRHPHRTITPSPATSSIATVTRPPPRSHPTRTPLQTTCPSLPPDQSTTPHQPARHCQLHRTPLPPARPSIERSSSAGHAAPPPAKARPVQQLHAIGQPPSPDRSTTPPPPPATAQTPDSHPRLSRTPADSFRTPRAIPRSPLHRSSHSGASSSPIGARSGAPCGAPLPCRILPRGQIPPWHTSRSPVPCQRAPALSAGHTHTRSTNRKGG